MVYIKKKMSMSNLNIEVLSLNIPKNVNISWGHDFLKVEGPLGVLIKKKDGFDLGIKDSTLYLLPLNNYKPFHFYVSKIRSFIVGVSKGYRRKIKLVGVGFKGLVSNKKLLLKVGFSHEVSYNIPNDIQIYSSKMKGIILLVKGKEKERVRQTVMEIRNFRQPDIYKGKGIHDENEVLRLKKGKREGK